MPRTRRKPAPTELEPTQVVRLLEHAGKFLAWSEDETQIVAVGDSPEEIREIALRAGHPRFIHEWVPPANVRLGTGLE